MSLQPGNRHGGSGVARSKVFARFGDEPLSNPGMVTTPSSRGAPRTWTSGARGVGTDSWWPTRCCPATSRCGIASGDSAHAVETARSRSSARVTGSSSPSRCACQYSQPDPASAWSSRAARSTVSQRCSPTWINPSSVTSATVLLRSGSIGVRSVPGGRTPVVTRFSNVGSSSGETEVAGLQDELDRVHSSDLSGVCNPHG